jgi:hypothetical protein
MALTKKQVEKWQESFTKKLERETSRNDMDRLLLSVDRAYFDDDKGAGWTKVKFENGRGRVKYKNGETGFKITPFQEKLLSKENVKKELKDDNWIPKSKLDEETGVWITKGNDSKSIFHAGGEAVVYKEIIGAKEYVVRVHAFDTAIFTPKCSNDDLVYDIHLPTGKMKKKSKNKLF